MDTFHSVIAAQFGSILRIILFKSLAPAEVDRRVAIVSVGRRDAALSNS